MGVGEDEGLGEAIAVTVIATGFNIDQQDDIVNTESKKIIHTLEDEQRAEHNLTPRNVVHQLVEEEEIKATPVKHNPVQEEPKMDLIPTTNFIRNFNVFYEEVVAENVQDDFIIINASDEIKDMEVVDPRVVSHKMEEEDQFEFSFDMPLAKKPVEEEEEAQHIITFDLDEEVKDFEVKDHVEVIPVLEYNKNGEKRYSLDDYMELEKKLTGAKSKAEEFEPRIVEDELIFEKRTIAKQESNQQRVKVEDEDPVNTPIEILLKERADERRKKLKDFNYKFQNSLGNLDEISKQPAYKRQGISLNENPKESKVSRTSLSEDSNDDIQLRSNNSYLHDNVD
jgi:cell division protein FtsZ